GAERPGARHAREREQQSANFRRRYGHPAAGDGPVAIGRAVGIALPVDDVVGHIDRARREAKHGEAPHNLKDFLDASEMTGKQQRREDKSVLDPVLRSEQGEQIQRPVDLSDPAPLGRNYILVQNSKLRPTRASGIKPSPLKGKSIIASAPGEGLKAARSNGPTAQAQCASPTPRSLAAIRGCRARSRRAPNGRRSTKLG